MKNVTVSVFPESIDFGTSGLDGRLAGQWRPIGKTEKECWGFVDVQPYSGEPTQVIAGGNMLAIQRQQRYLPGWAVNDELERRVLEIEGQICGKVGKKARQDMKEEVIIDLLPQTFVQKKVFYAWLGSDRLLIDSKSAAVCDAITHLLREALGSLPCINVAPRSVPGAVLASWMKDAALFPKPFELGGESVIRGTEDDPAMIRIKQADLYQRSVDDALECCPMVKEMALSHNDAISFTLNEQLQLSKIKLSDTLQEQLNDDSEGDKAAEQRATWSLQVTAINSALTDIFAAMDGMEGVGA